MSNYSYMKVCNYDMYMHLSQDFKLGEFIQSDTAMRNKLIMQYVHQPNIVDNLKFLCEALLQPLRDRTGHPIIVSSGYRCLALNMMVGGAKTSLHTKGYAADIYCPKAHSLMIEELKNMRYHELILHDSYVHVSIKPEWNQMKFQDLRR